MTLSTIDLVVVILYAVGIFGLAQWVSRDKGGHQKDSSDAGTGVILILIALYATWW